MSLADTKRSGGRYNFRSFSPLLGRGYLRFSKQSSRAWRERAWGLAKHIGQDRMRRVEDAENRDRAHRTGVVFLLVIVEGERRIKKLFRLGALSEFGCPLARFAIDSGTDGIAHAPARQPPLSISSVNLFRDNSSNRYLPQSRDGNQMLLPDETSSQSQSPDLCQLA